MTSDDDETAERKSRTDAAEAYRGAERVAEPKGQRTSAAFDLSEAEIEQADAAREEAMRSIAARFTVRR